MAALSAAPIPDLSEESDELDEPDLSDEEPDWLDESLVPSLESLWELFTVFVENAVGSSAK